MNQSGCSINSLMTWPILVDHFRPTFLQATLEVLQCELSDIEMTHCQKENLARVFIESFLLNFSGRARSFPLASNRYALLKRKAAYKAFTGDNINDLVGRFGITGSVLYSYIRQERASRRAAFNAQTQNG